MTGREANERMLARATRVSRVALAPPRELRFSRGTISWKHPADTSGITHYRIYANSESNLVREVPSSQTSIADNLVADRVFISSYSKPLGYESAKTARIDGPIAPTGSSIDVVPSYRI